jgi:hypothetical protein
MTTDVTTILGDAAASHVPVLVDILDGIGEHNYDFMSGHNFGVVARQDWIEGQRIYWLEILHRAHFASSTSLSRTSRWIDAMLPSSRTRTTPRSCQLTAAAWKPRRTVFRRSGRFRAGWPNSHRHPGCSRPHDRATDFV